MENFPGAWRIFRNSVTWRIAISHTISHAQIEGAHSVDSSSSRHLLSPSERRAPSLRLFLSHTLRREALSLTHMYPHSFTHNRVLTHSLTSRSLTHRVGRTLTHSPPNLTQSGGLTHSQPKSHTLCGGHNHASSLYLTRRRGHAHCHSHIYT